MVRINVHKQQVPMAGMVYGCEQVAGIQQRAEQTGDCKSKKRSEAARTD